MIINHNLSAMFTSRYEGINVKALQSSSEKLSSGLRINSAKDGASELSISESMKSQIRGLDRASRNVSDGISLMQVADGFMQSTTDILQRIRELAVQSANGIWDNESRMQMQTEISQLVAEVDRIASTAQFNGYNMLTGRFEENGLKLQVGANMDQSVEVKIDRLTAEHLDLKGQEGTISVLDQDSANMTISTIDEALKKVNKNRSDLGAMQNRMELALKGNNIAKENMIASESRIRDTDYASEMVEFTKNSILNQASAAMLSQANNQHTMVLKLLS